MRSNEIGREIKYSNQRSIDELNMDYRPVEETLIDAAKVIIEKRLFPKEEEKK